MSTNLENRLNINYNEVCRVCLAQSPSLFEIFTIVKSYTDGISIPEKIVACASIQISNDDGLPQKICKKCSVMLDIAYEFKQICEASDRQLKQYNAPIYKIIEADSLNANNIVPQNGTKNEDYSENEVYGSIESVYDSNENEVSNRKVEDEIKPKVKKKVKKSSKEDNKYARKVYQCETCGKSFHRREYLVQHIRIHTGEKPYSCHICQKRFVNSGHLTTHMRTHTGIKPHSCDICPKAFSTKQELTKHLMVHRGERPYACNYCSRTFGSSSNLYTHLKHHTGEKNFTCDQCGKAFYTKQELKQHLVTHTGEKAFVCQVCSKRFSQIAHVKRHLKKLHKTI